MAQRHTKKLLVEGIEDKFAIIHLMAKHIRWGNSRDEWPVLVEVAGSVSELLDKDFLSVQLKASDSETLGIVLDANDSLDGRWRRTRTECTSIFPGMPQGFPAEGLIVANAGGQRFGVWIMPDNLSVGMLETFLAQLVPDRETNPLWQHACTAAEEAKSKGAPFKDVHLHKAQIHSWLAWQNPPGQQLHIAIISRCLDGASPCAAPFVAWFKKLYNL